MVFSHQHAFVSKLVLSTEQILFLSYTAPSYLTLPRVPVSETSPPVICWSLMRSTCSM